jgi:hypothetical protein
MANARRQAGHGYRRRDAIRLVVLLMFALSAGTTGCSVYLATRPPPDTIGIQEGRPSRAEVLSALGQPTTTSTSTGKVVDVFKLHHVGEADPDQVKGLLLADFATLGFYEVLATPAELVRELMQKSADYVVTYGQDGRVESVKVIPE